MHVQVALVAGLVSLLAGLGVPRLIASLPEPEARPEDAPDDGPEAGPAKELYVEVARRSGLRRRVALTSAGAGGLVGLVVGWDVSLLVLLVVVPVAVALAEIDLRTRLLPTRLVLPATGVVLGLVVLDAVRTGSVHDLQRAVLGLLVARSVYWLLWRFRSAGMGFGDVRLAALLGLSLAFVGWPEFVVGLYAAFLIFGIPGLVLALVRRDRSLLRATFPFGPFMVVGALLGVVCGDPVAGWLLGV